MTNRGRLSTANDLLDALVAESNYLGYGSPAHRGCGFTDRSVAFFSGVDVALRGAFESFFGGHKYQSSLLDKPSRKVDNTDMNDEQHALNTANDILNGIYETWKEGHPLEDCTKIAAHALGVDERTIDNAVLYSLTGGQGFVSQFETLPAHCQPGWTR